MRATRRFLAALVALIAAGATADTAYVDRFDFKHGIAFFHELKYPPGFESLDYLNPAAPKGGSVVLTHPFAFDTLAPLTVGGVRPPSGFYFTNETLIIRAGDEVSAFYGRLADGIAVSEDGRTLAFRIHPEARWWDGVPVTADDVVYTIGARKAQVTAGFWLSFISSVEALDDRHVVFHLANPVTLNNVIMIQFTPILPEHYWRDRDPEATTFEFALGSSAYRVTDVSPGRYIEYERNDDYWGKDLPVNKGRYNFDTVRYEIFRDATVTREAFRKGLIDIFDETDVRYWHDSYDVPALEKGWIRKIRRSFGIEIGVRQALGFNNRLAKFNDRRVREALTLAFDFEWQNETLHHGQHARAQSWFPDTILAATGLPSADELELLEPFRDQLPAEVFTKPFRFPPSSDRREHLERARTLLTSAGWRINAAGVLVDANDEPFTIEFLSRTPSDARVLLPYIEELKHLGIVGNIRLIDLSQMVNRLRHFEFDALLKNQDILMPPVFELMSTYHSSAAATVGSRNHAGVSDPVVDYLVEKANLATTLEDMVAACRALDRVLLWQYYQIPLHAVALRRTVHWDKFGRPDFEGDYWPAYPDGWWFDPVRAARIAESK